MLRDRRVQAGRQRQAQHVAGLDGIEDSVIPQPRRSMIRIAFVLVFLANGSLELLHLLLRPLVGIAVDRSQYRGRLLAAHHTDAAVGPSEEKTRPEGAAAHP